MNNIQSLLTQQSYDNRISKLVGLFDINSCIDHGLCTDYAKLLSNPEATFTYESLHTFLLTKPWQVLDNTYDGKKMETRNAKYLWNDALIYTLISKYHLHDYRLFDSYSSVLSPSLICDIRKADERLVVTALSHGLIPSASQWTKNIITAEGEITVSALPSDEAFERYLPAEVDFPYGVMSAYVYERHFHRFTVAPLSFVGSFSQDFWLEEKPTIDLSGLADDVNPFMYSNIPSNVPLETLIENNDKHALYHIDLTGDMLDQLLDNWNAGHSLCMHHTYTKTTDISNHLVGLLTDQRIRRYTAIVNQIVIVSDLELPCDKLKLLIDCQKPPSGTCDIRYVVPADADRGLFEDYLDHLNINVLRDSTRPVIEYIDLLPDEYVVLNPHIINDVLLPNGRINRFVNLILDGPIYKYYGLCIALLSSQPLTVLTVNKLKEKLKGYNDIGHVTDSMFNIPYITDTAHATKPLTDTAVYVRSFYVSPDINPNIKLKQFSLVKTSINPTLTTVKCCAYTPSGCKYTTSIQRDLTPEEVMIYIEHMTGDDPLSEETLDELKDTIYNYASYVLNRVG